MDRGMRSFAGVLLGVVLSAIFCTMIILVATGGRGLDGQIYYLQDIADGQAGSDRACAVSEQRAEGARFFRSIALYFFGLVVLVGAYVGGRIGYNYLPAKERNDKHNTT
ncbi:MAG: hypothetical protein ABIH21_02705 [Patescibacteria group bacterium]